MRILVVEDEARAGDYLKQGLTEAGFVVDVARDGHTGLHLAVEQAYDLVVLDVDMPGMNGYEVCTKLRALPAYKETPVIFVTSLSDFQSRARSTLSGANDLIAKPFVFVELSVKALSYLLKAELAKPRKA